jgi:CRP-like cAMP-binding protein
MATIEDLMQSNLFKGIEAAELEKVLLNTKEETFLSGKRIFNEGEAADLLYIILDGILDLTFKFKMGEVETEITADTKGRGHSVGWSAIISPHVYTLSGICRENVNVLTVDRKTMLSLCEENPHFGFIFMHNIAGLVGSRMKQLQSMFIKEVQRGISKI